jgi:hypothetical protein
VLKYAWIQYVSLWVVVGWIGKKMLGFILEQGVFSTEKVVASASEKSPFVVPAIKGSEPVRTEGFLTGAPF